MYIGSLGWSEKKISEKENSQNPLLRCDFADPNYGYVDQTARLTSNEFKIQDLLRSDDDELDEDLLDYDEPPRTPEDAKTAADKKLDGSKTGAAGSKPEDKGTADMEASGKEDSKVEASGVQRTVLSAYFLSVAVHITTAFL